MSEFKRNIYFVGIGGIGMSALARYFSKLGHSVAGYDREETTLTKKMQAEGIAIISTDSVDLIESAYNNPADTLVVYTPAISSDNKILTHFMSDDFECVKRARLLGMLSSELPTIAVAGTHGKTTVSAMIAYLLHHGGIKINAFLGGISRNFDTNLILDEGAKIMVTEADEYDRSFLQLYPQTAVITATDIDHLDIYQNSEGMLQAYNQFASQIKEGGVLFTKAAAAKTIEKSEQHTTKIYGFENGDVAIKKVHITDGNFVFDLHINGKEIPNIKCGMPGLHNVENAAVAFAVALEHGVSVEKAKEAIMNFKGVQRRFDVHIKRKDMVYIDDYAHHPEEIKALLNSVKEMYPNRKITAVFQPHLYSRTKDFGNEFASVLSAVDQLILLDLYPAREKPIDGISSNWLAEKIKLDKIQVVNKVELLACLKKLEIDILLTIGAGDINRLVLEIINQYQ